MTIEVLNCLLVLTKSLKTEHYIHGNINQQMVSGYSLYNLKKTRQKANKTNLCPGTDGH